MSKFRLYKLILFLALVSTNLAKGQNTENFQIGLFRYLSPLNTSSCLFDNQKRLYCASQSGTYFLNGKVIKKISFGKSSNKLIESGSSRRLYLNSKKKHLFAWYFKQGVAILNDKHSIPFFQLLDIEGLAQQDEIIDINFLGDSYIIATTNKIIVFELKANEADKNFSVSVVKQIPVPETIQQICITPSNHLMIITRNKVLRDYIKDSYGNINCLYKLPLPFIDVSAELFIFNATEARFYLGTSYGLFIFTTTNSKCIILSKQLSGQSVYSICLLYDGTTYVAASKGLYKLDNNYHCVQVVEANNQKDQSILSTVYNIYADSNKVWLASQEGIAMFDHLGTPFYSVKNTETFKPNHVYQIGEDRNNKITLSCENGLYNYNKSGALSVLKKEDTYFLSAKTPDKRQMVSTINHTFIQKGHNFISIEKVYKEFKDFEGLSFNDCERTDDGGMILSTENEMGVYRWDYMKKKMQRIDNNTGLPQITQVNNLYKKDSDVFILTDDNVYSYSASGLRKYDVSQGVKHFGVFFDMLEVKGHYILTSYDNGVIETDNAFRVLRIFNTTNGLSDNEVYRLASVGDSILLVSSNSGLNAINLSNGKVKVFTEEDGLHNNVFEEFSSYQKDSKIYFGGKNGFTIVSPEKMNFSIDTFNNLHFTECKVINDKNISNEFELNDTAKISFSNNITQVKISFHNLIYPYKERIKYSYKITEFHNYWIDLGNTNFMTLPVLNPGTYHLQVKAANEDGVWSEPKELILIFEPKWYQTRWFYLLISLTVAGILYALYRYRISQIKKQHAIRKNIATDLHDDLGSTLNSVKVFTNLAISGVKQEESLQQVKDNLTEATMSLRDMIWVLDDSLDTVDELITRLKQFAIPVTAASNIEALIKADSEVNNRQLTKEEKRNLFLICKEAINNSIKYSGANHIDVNITASGKKIQIVVLDNGKGFNVDEVRKGYGLKNMQYRAGQIKYKVVLVSSPGNGTQIKILPS